ncbi:MAG: hypothetical protein H0S84_01435 [Bacteroidales bacterium]|nr:hypothetical protein [Bacteroidales bacterium]
MKWLILPVLLFFTTQLFAQSEDFLPQDYAQQAINQTTQGIAPNQAIDQNIHTFWESDAPLPENYIYNPDLNAFHPRAAHRLIRSSDAATDADLNTAININQKRTLAVFSHKITLLEPVKSYRISVKLGNSEIVKLTIAFADGSIFVNDINTEKKYSLIALFPDNGKYISHILMESTASFQLFEVACLSQKPFVDFQLDLNKTVQLGQIYSRHFNSGKTESIQYLGSEDGKKWNLLHRANPMAIGMIPVVLNHPTAVRYFKIRFNLSNTDYTKAVLWELKLFDKNGPYGAALSFKPSIEPLINRIGLNMVWGWGQQQYSEQINNSKGWRQFSGIFKKLRLYHFLYWDIPKPGISAAYESMAAKGTAANWWLNWDREYGFLKSQGFEILSTILFKNSTFPDSLWQMPEAEAHAIGREFAIHFGTKKFAEAVEAGNEPWDYQPAFYQKLGSGMMQGFTDANSNLLRLPAAFQATFRQHSYDDQNNFLPDFITTSMIKQSDALNIHLYSYANDSLGNLIALPPENPQSPINALRNMLLYRDRYAPQAEVWVTEFGYDSDGGGENCTHSNCISAEKQVAWGVRATLKLLREGADRVYWYFYANENTDSYYHSRSGLTASAKNNFEPKPAYFAFEKLMSVLGNTTLTEIVEEKKTHSIYRFQELSGGKVFLVAWLHHENDPEQSLVIKHSAFKKAKQMLKLDGNAMHEWEKAEHSELQKLSGFPIIFELTD